MIFGAVCALHQFSTNQKAPYFMTASRTLLLSLPALAFILAGCEADKETIKRMDSDNFRLRKEITTLTEQLRKANLDMEVEKASRERADEEIKATRARFEQLRKELEEARELHENYRRDFQLQSRIRAVGQKFPELATTEGKVYRDVTIRAVLTDSINILHATGSARLSIASLGDKWLRRFDVGASAPVCMIEEETLKAACEDAFKARR